MALFDFLKRGDKAPKKNLVKYPLPKIINQSPSAAVQLPERDEIRPNIQKIRPLKNTSLIYRLHNSSFRTRSGAGQFRSPEYNLSEVGRVEDVDGYVGQAFNKKTALMFKEGYCLSGRNNKHIRYINIRLQQIAHATGIPTNTLLRGVGRDLIRLSNAFLLRIRKVEASGGREYVAPGTKTTLKPVAGYFHLPAETMQASVDDFGNILGWKQLMPDGQFKHYRPNDVVHFHFNRKTGFVFGTPTIVPVLDDIRALRRIEENVEILVHQHIFPLFQHVVGNKDFPAGTLEDGTDEIEFVRQQIDLMPSEGGIVTTERHEIRAIGAEGRALRAESYLDHFKRRVFSGLGMSSVDFGEGATANRNTASTMSKSLVDGVKDFQRILEDQFNELIIKELMMESTFDPDELFLAHSLVKLKFNEIDIDARIKKENHAGQLFQINGITHDEFRGEIGKEPIDFPSYEDMRNNPEGIDQAFDQAYKLHWKLFEEPKLMIQSVDEPWSALSIAAARSRATDIVQSDLNSEEQTKRELLAQELSRESKSTATAKGTSSGERNKVTPVSSNQHGSTTEERKSSFKSINILDSFVSDIYENFRAHLINSVDSTNILIADLLGRTHSSAITKNLNQSMRRNFINGFNSVNRDVETLAKKLRMHSVEIEMRSSRFPERLIKQIVSALNRHQFDRLSRSAKISLINNTFDALKFRTKLIFATETQKAKNLGVSEGLKALGATSIRVESSLDADCSKCLNKDSVAVNILSLEEIIPTHPHCECSISISSSLKE